MTAPARSDLPIGAVSEVCRRAPGLPGTLGPIDWHIVNNEFRRLECSTHNRDDELIARRMAQLAA